MADDFEKKKEQALYDIMVKRHQKRLAARNTANERVGTIGSLAKNPVEDELNIEREENLFGLKDVEPAGLRTLFESRPAGTPFPSSRLPKTPKRY